MRARSIALALIGGPVMAHLLIAQQAGLDPSTWPQELKFFALLLAATFGLGLACVSEGDFDARA